MSDPRRAPDLDRETPHLVAGDLLEQTHAALTERFGDRLDDGDAIDLVLRRGDGAGHLWCAVGPSHRPHVFEFFCRDVEGPFAGGALAVLLDFCEGSLEQYFDEDKDAGFALDYVGHPFEGHIVFAKSELRDFHAEQLADEWLKDHDL